ncbi:hypothetical protein ACRAWF_02125 [Streptomyces sp. L7]
MGPDRPRPGAAGGLRLRVRPQSAGRHARAADAAVTVAQRSAVPPRRSPASAA